MYNYAYNIGKVIKIGMALDETANIKHRLELQRISDLGALMRGAETIPVVEIWSRPARSHKEVHRLKAIFEDMFKEYCVLSTSLEWLKSDDRVTSFFANLIKNGDNGDKVLKSLLELRYGPEI